MRMIEKEKMGKREGWRRRKEEMEKRKRGEITRK